MYEQGSSDVVQFYDSVLEVQAERLAEKKTSTIKLQPIAQNGNAVYQTVLDGGREELNDEPPWSAPTETVCIIFSEFDIFTTYIFY